VSWPSDGRPRFVVGIDTGIKGGVIAYVFDRAYCHRTMFEVRSGFSQGVQRRISKDEAVAEVHAQAEELNAWHDAAVEE
jgi:hypothetical protein